MADKLRADVHVKRGIGNFGPTELDWPRNLGNAPKEFAAEDYNQTWNTCTQKDQACRLRGWGQFSTGIRFLLGDAPTKAAKGIVVTWRRFGADTAARVADERIHR
jgi:hypothetical protein